MGVVLHRRKWFRSPPSVKRARKEASRFHFIVLAIWSIIVHFVANSTAPWEANPQQFASAMARSDEGREKASSTLSIAISMSIQSRPRQHGTHRKEFRLEQSMRLIVFIRPPGACDKVYLLIELEIEHQSRRARPCYGLKSELKELYAILCHWWDFCWTLSV